MSKSDDSVLVFTKATVDQGDYWPATYIGITSVASTTWWIVTWFVFIKNTPGDNVL